MSVVEASAPARAFLTVITGPEMAPIELPARPGGLTMGRHDACELRLPSSAEQVSRFHARFSADDEGKWRVADLGSRWGTFLNGQKLERDHEMPLAEGDLVRVMPWTFLFTRELKRKGLRSVDDTGQTVVRQHTYDAQQPIARELLTLLLDAAARIHSSANEHELAERLIDSALRGTGLQNAAVIKPVDAEGTYDVIASKFGTGGDGAKFSRSLINAASDGNVAEIASNSDLPTSHSIVQMRISNALCIPLMLQQTPAAFLYLDARGTSPQSSRPDATAFATALGHIASMALANLKRAEMEKREAEMRSDLAAAVIAQKMILPPREKKKIGRFTTLGESRPGKSLGGDFFDVIDLGEGKVAVAVGDVAGKGITASVLMTASQGFLHSALTQSGDVAAAVSALTRFVHPRRPMSKFVTLWTAILDAERGKLSYVDAGHSYALLVKPDCSIQVLSEGGGLPIGIEEDLQYEAVTIDISRGDRLFIVSDGIIEQFGTVIGEDGSASREQFEVDGLKNVLSRCREEDPIKAIFDAVVAHAGSTQLGDDATAVLVMVD